MTTPEPRVRVTYDETEAQFIGQCGACHKTLQRRRIFLSGALRDAHRHAAECPAFRLARLLRELEALRDSRVNMQPTDLVTWGIKSEDHCRGWAAAQRQAATDLTAVLARAGGTGC